MSVIPTDDNGGWNAVGTSLRGPPSSHADCLRLLKIVVSALQAEFDLAPEPQHPDVASAGAPLEPSQPHFRTGGSFDEVADKITQVALALRENIEKPSSPPSSPETTPPQSWEAEQQPQDAEHQPEAVEHQPGEAELKPEDAEHHPQQAEHHRNEFPPLKPPAIETTPIVESIYPEQPRGALVAPNHITIDQGRAEFDQFNATVDDLLTLLRESTEFSGEVRDQLIAEILAGRALLGAPKADPILIERFLANPLKYIAKKSTETNIGALTVAMLMRLGKLTSWW